MTSLSNWISDYKNIVNPDYIKARLSFRFIFGVLKQIIYELKNPKSPWLNPNMVYILDNLLTGRENILEIGGGKSTIWFSKRVNKITTIESSKSWLNTIKNQLKHYKISNSELVYLPSSRNSYFSHIKKIPNQSLDMCLIDGEFREDCFLWIASKIKKGGIIVLDNAETYIPNPKSISFKCIDKSARKPILKKYLPILKLTKNWKKIVTSSEIQDTTLWIKP